MHVDIQCYEGRNLDTVTQIETLDPWGDAIARDYPSYTTATAVLETCDRLTEEREPALQQYLLLAGALRSLAGGSTSRSSCSTPSCCARSPSPAGRRASTTAPARGARTAPRVPRALRWRGVLRLPPTWLDRARSRDVRAACALLSGDWAIADASDAQHRREGSGLIAAFLQWHLERGVRSLRLVERA